MSMRFAARPWFAVCLIFVACDGAPTVPEEPTWADVEPILRAQCNHCHGASARKTGSAGALVYRFDFYDMTDAVCGEAAQALDGGPTMARGWAPLIRSSVSAKNGGRSRMPPAPANPLADWERKTLVRWADQPFPSRGGPRANNRRPQIRISAPKVANTRLAFAAVVDDADGESVVGVLKVANTVLKMDRAGSFSTTLETGGWAPGRYPITAVLCDGWGSSTYRLGAVEVLHDEASLSQVTLYSPSTDPTGNGQVRTDSSAAGSGGAGPGAGGQGGRGAGGGGTGAAGGSAGSGGAGGAGAGGARDASDSGPGDTAAPDVAKPDMRAMGECADLDGNGVLDCRETLVKNADLKKDVASWSPEATKVTVAFAAEDGENTTGSGSIAVTNANAIDVDGLSLAGARQCLSLTAASYDVRAQIKVPGGPGLEGVQGGVNLQFFSDANCAATVVGFFASPSVGDKDVWREVQGVATSAIGARSMSVRLVVLKPFRLAPSKALFDNILVKAR